ARRRGTDAGRRGARRRPDGRQPWDRGGARLLRRRHVGPVHVRPVHLQRTDRVESRGAPAMKVDLLDGDFYAGDPYPTYQWLRENAPAYWDEVNRLWGVSRHADVVAIEKDPLRFC